MQKKSVQSFGRGWVAESGQGLAEYGIVLACAALAVAGLLAAWKWPLAHYLSAVVQMISKTR